MRKFRMVSLGLALAAAVLLSRPAVSQTGTTTTTAQVSSRAVTIDGQPAGEVLIGNTVVLRIREAAGGYTAPQRAAVVASRLTGQLAQGYTWQNVTVGRMNNESVLMMGDTLLITADRRAAVANNTSPAALADGWRGTLVASLRQTGTGVVAGTQETAWPDWTNATTKVVPIVAVGTGVSVGFAQVTGPQNRVDDVRSVVQLQVTFQRAARVFVFVPSSSLAGLNRVQGVAVSALLQYQLFNF